MQLTPLTILSSRNNNNTFKLHAITFITQIFFLFEFSSSRAPFYCKLHFIFKFLERSNILAISFSELFYKHALKLLIWGRNDIASSHLEKRKVGKLQQPMQWKCIRMLFLKQNKEFFIQEENRSCLTQVLILPKRVELFYSEINSIDRIFTILRNNFD